ncbi:MAG: nucleotidyltransferase family protein [Gammaproteobacteria bacterium]|nr:nucleotidyltransferase family protein [Gammaproteobacteria bacterium]
MKAMILAAGLGTRMLPLTADTPKPLLKVGGRSLIEYHILNLAAAGVTDIVINHFYLGEKIEKALGDGRDYGVRIVYSPEIERMETAGGIIRALPLLGDDPFIVVSGDIWTEFPFASLTPVDGDKVLARLVMVNNPEHHSGGDFHLDQTGLLSKPPEGSTLPCFTYSGVSVMHPKLFAGYSEAPLPLRPLLLAAMLHHQLQGQLYTGPWLDIGTPARLHDLDCTLATLAGQTRATY